jgi:hypothetical protein
MDLSLTLGPANVVDAPPLDVLERGWKIFRSVIMTPGKATRPGWKPWGYWVFEIGEEWPPSYKQ